MTIRFLLPPAKGLRRAACRAFGIAGLLWLLSACGGAGGSSATSAPPAPLPPPTPANGQSHPCSATLQTGAELNCQLRLASGELAQWSLLNAPEGMAVQTRSGRVHWTPGPHQSGTFTLNAAAETARGSLAQSWTVTVTPGRAAPPGLFVSPQGDDANPGTIERPYKTLQRAVDRATPGSTIFVRGGVYRNAEFGMPWPARTVNNLVRITQSGTTQAPIHLRPHGNEYVRLVSDVNGIAIAGAQHWIIEGLELEGLAQSMDLDLALANWWSEEGNSISGRGIANGGSQHIAIRDCVIHDFPGAGLSSNDADWITVQNNIIYNTGWWTTAGTHGVANSKLLSADRSGAALEKIVLDGNLLFGNQSLVISHVFSKGFVTLTIDEGNGLHLQNTAGTFFGRARVENNLVLFNGKAGLGLNTIDQVTVRRNAFYRNARVVDTGELALQSSTLEDASGNLFHPRPNRHTIKDSESQFLNIGANATTGAATDGAQFPAVLRAPAVFRNPAALDFGTAAGLPATMGVPDAHLQRMTSKLSEYGILVQEPTQLVDEAYLQRMKQQIFARWPASMSQLTLDDRATGYRYRYEQRCQWPAAPSSTPCP